MSELESRIKSILSEKEGNLEMSEEWTLVKVRKIVEYLDGSGYLRVRVHIVGEEVGDAYAETF